MIKTMMAGLANGNCHLVQADQTDNPVLGGSFDFSGVQNSLLGLRDKPLPGRGTLVCLTEACVVTSELEIRPADGAGKVGYLVVAWPTDPAA